MNFPRTLFRPILLLLALSLGAMTNASAQTRDVAGAKDYPGIGRFGGSVITGYQVKDFDAARMQGAAFKDGQPTDARRLEGRITRIAYRTNPGPSILEVSRNFETQLAKAGFETLLACDTDACGGIPFSEGIDALPIPQMWVDGFNYRYFAGARRTAGAKPMPASSSARTTARSTRSSSSPNSARSRTRWWMRREKGLGEAGHIALYGIYFDTDKAVVKPESRPTLEQIAKLLAGQPQLSVFIVGHTDNQGAYDYNLDLSRRRAEAVAAELVRTYGIAWRGCAPRRRFSRAGWLQRERGRPRAEPAGGAGGAVASTRGPTSALAHPRDNGYDQVQWFQSRNGNCGRRADGNSEGDRAGANACRRPFAIAPPRYRRRALSIVQCGNGRGYRWTVLEALQGECFSAVGSRR